MENEKLTSRKLPGSHRRVVEEVEPRRHRWWRLDLPWVDWSCWDGRRIVGMSVEGEESAGWNEKKKTRRVSLGNDAVGERR